MESKLIPLLAMVPLVGFLVWAIFVIPGFQLLAGGIVIVLVIIGLFNLFLWGASKL